MNKPSFSTIAMAGLKAAVVAVLVNLALFFLFRRWASSTLPCDSPKPTNR